MDAGAVESALDALEAAGARGYDAAACDCVRALLTRAEELGGAAAEILVRRAQTHVESLSERFGRDKQRVRAAVEQLEHIHGPQEELRRTLERGEVTRVGRAVRRLASRPAPARAALPSSTDAQAPHELPGSPSALYPRERAAQRRKRATVYEDSVAELVASFALARAVDVVPEHAGPYNPLRIASDALDTMRAISPFYLTVQLNRLEELASLLALPELPAKVEEKVLPRKKRGALKG